MVRSLVKTSLFEVMRVNAAPVISAGEGRWLWSRDCGGFDVVGFDRSHLSSCVSSCVFVLCFTSRNSQRAVSRFSHLIDILSVRVRVDAGMPSVCPSVLSAFMTLFPLSLPPLQGCAEGGCVFQQLLVRNPPTPRGCFPLTPTRTSAGLFVCIQRFSLRYKPEMLRGSLLHPNTH